VKAEPFQSKREKACRRVEISNSSTGSPQVVGKKKAGFSKPWKTQPQKIPNLGKQKQAATQLLPKVGTSR
jgi:hypothetical protein